MPVLIAAVTLLGLAIGSFLNVVIYRLPRNESLAHPPSACPKCGSPIRARHNIPVFGWLLLRGRCADCHSSISIRYPLVELATAGLLIALTLRLHRLGLLSALPAYLLFAAVAVALTMIDIDVHRLPNALVLPAYPVLALALTIAAAVSDTPSALVRAGICSLGLFALYFILWFAYPAGMGYGDVRLAGIVGGMLGYLSFAALFVGAFLAFVLGGSFGMAVIALRRGNRKSHLPFGPFMIGGSLLAIFAGDPLWHLYSSFVLST